MSFNSELRKDPGINDMLSGEGLYTFGSVVRSERRAPCLEKLWKVEAVREVSLWRDREFLGTSKAKRGFMAMWSSMNSKNCRNSGVFCKSPSGEGLSIFGLKTYKVMEVSQLGIENLGDISRWYTRFCEVSLDGINFFKPAFYEPPPLKLDSRNFGVLVRDQTTVLVEVMISHPWRGNFEKEDRRLRNICAESWRVSCNALENYGLGFESSLEEGNDGWMRDMLILRRYLLKKKRKMCVQELTLA